MFCSTNLWADVLQYEFHSSMNPGSICLDNSGSIATTQCRKYRLSIPPI